MRHRAQAAIPKPVVSNPIPIEGQVLNSPIVFGEANLPNRPGNNAPMFKKLGSDRSDHVGLSSLSYLVSKDFTDQSMRFGRPHVWDLCTANMLEDIYS